MSSSEPPTAEDPAGAEVIQQKDRKGAGGKQGKEPSTPTDAPKLSGAELKKKAKEEKAARRAQAALEKTSGGIVPTSVNAPGLAQKADPQKGQKGSTQKKGAQVAVEARGLPSRGIQRTVPVAEVPKEEDKTVEFFRHLYKTRTTSIAGAGKEVHPAVLSLGLQMGSYTICGSSARLVATLQAFKRVSSEPLTFMLHELN